MDRRIALGMVLGWTLACSGPEATSEGTGATGGAPATPPPPVATTASAASELPADMPDYQATPYTKAELEAMSLTQLQIRRNTIFARAGQPFRKKWLDQHFRQYDWYKPLAAMDTSRLTAVDRENAALIASVETGLTQEQLRDRKRKVAAYEGPDSWEIQYDHQQEREIALLSQALGEWEGDPSVPMSDRSPLQDPHVLDSPITEAQLADLSRRDLRIVRNTVFARHGRAFKSELLQEYFAQKVWYTVDPAYSDDRLTDVDRANIATIIKVEESLGGMLTEAQQREFEDQYMSMA